VLHRVRRARRRLAGRSAATLPAGFIERDDTTLAELVRQVVAFIKEPKAALSLPLDLRGTVFQRRVWNALCRIPPGETWTYTQLAESIGAPRAVRAVARSCATNPVSLAVPCHRVIGADGQLTGYRWGVPQKRVLIEKEGQLRQQKEGVLF